MGRAKRSVLVDPDRCGYYHCYSACVRRAFLIGYDDDSGKKDEHRKEWIERRQEQLLDAYAVEMIGFSVMDNHMHHVLKTRPDWARKWTAEEVVRRWYSVHRLRDARGRLIELTDEVVAQRAADKRLVAVLRKRLASLSWFMKDLKERIAKRANAESGQTGRFWDDRFKSPRLLDSVALLLCLLYVELNPIRACLAETPERSRHTSIYARLEGYRLRTSRGDAVHIPGPSDPDRALSWIFRSEGEAETANDAGHAGEMFRLTFEQYAAVLDWSGRQVRGDKRGSIPADAAPIVERLGLAPEVWTEAIAFYGDCRHRAVGSVRAMEDAARCRELCCRRRIARCRTLFA